MEDTVIKSQQDERTLAEFYDQSEKETKSVLDNLQKQRTLAASFGLLNAKYREVQNLTQHPMFF